MSDYCPDCGCKHGCLCGDEAPLIKSESSFAAPAGSTFSFQEYVSKQQEWSARTFGDGPRTKGITAHIRKELEEVEAAPNDLEEWIDVMILALDGAWRCGGTPQTIAAMLERKQAKNFGRTYPKPMSQDHPSFHVKETSNGELSGGGEQPKPNYAEEKQQN